MKRDTIGIAGAGAWGTALGEMFCRAGRDVIVWANNREIRNRINREHANPAFLPGVALSPELRATLDPAEAAQRDILFLALPAQRLRAGAGFLAPAVRERQPVIICAKGIESDTGKLMGTVAAEVLPQALLATLSGPSFAADVSRGRPAAVTLGCEDASRGRALAAALANPAFRIYWTADRTGVELGGAIKNVLAIAAGIVLGKGLGESAHAAIITRGFAEMYRLALALGAKAETLMGLSGLGDLILTATSVQSRNMSLGLALGKGTRLEAILTGRRAVTEGVATAAAVVRLAKEAGVEMPIAEAVHAIVAKTCTVDDAIAQLLARPLKAET